MSQFLFGTHKIISFIQYIRKQLEGAYTIYLASLITLDNN